MTPSVPSEAARNFRNWGDFNVILKSVNVRREPEVPFSLDSVQLFLSIPWIRVLRAFDNSVFHELVAADSVVIL